MENNWIENVSGVCPVKAGTLIDVQYRDGKVKSKMTALFRDNGRDTQDAFWSLDGQKNDITYYRLHKPEQTLDDALGLPAGVTPYVYPQTSFKPSSEAQLRSDEAARINAILSEKLSTIADIASKLTRKNFSVADIKLVKDLLESVEEYEENR